MRRLLPVATVTAILLGVLASAAFGGGAVWHFEGYHRPGDVVESTTSVAWDHNSDLGTPDDGPYLIYLAPADAVPASWPSIPEKGMLVGIVEVYMGPYVAADGGSYGPNTAIARFEIPDVPPGDYQIFHCNDPCTATLGDIVGGWSLRIVGGGDGRSADEIASEVMDRLLTAPVVFEGTAPSPDRSTLDGVTGDCAVTASCVPIRIGPFRPM